MKMSQLAGLSFMAPLVLIILAGGYTLHNFAPELVMVMIMWFTGATVFLALVVMFVIGFIQFFDLK